MDEELDGPAQGSEREKQRERRPKPAREWRYAALSVSTAYVWLLLGATTWWPG